MPVVPHPLSVIALLCDEPPGTALLDAFSALPAAERIVSCAASGPLPARGELAWVRPLLGARGPVALLHAALLAARSEPLIALDARAPLPSPELLLELAQHRARGNLLLLDREPRAPCPGRYRRGCLRPLRAALARDEQDLLAVARALHATLVVPR